LVCPFLFLYAFAVSSANRLSFTTIPNTGRRAFIRLSAKNAGQRFPGAENFAQSWQ
jgi:hypothetical protein